jgi:Transposase DDE domain/Insertion element 4 transposase N-terminal
MSHANTLPTIYQVARTGRNLSRQEALPFARHLPEQQIHQAVRATGVSFRERIFSPAVTLWTFLSQVFDPDHSCRQAVARLLAFRVAQGLRPCSADTGAYCKARQRLPEKALHDLVRGTGRQLMDQGQPAWRWKGRHVKIVDGTGLSAPDTKANQKEYPKRQTLPAGVGFPLVRLVVVFSLAVGTVLDAALGRFQGKGGAELPLFRTLDDALEPGDVLLGDRLYADFWDVARLAFRGIDVVMRMHAGRAKVWFGGRGHSTGNRRTWWRKTKRPDWMTQEEYDVLPQWLRLRVVRVDVRQRGFRSKRLLLVTTLTDAEAYPAEDLAALYRMRWHAELNLRSIKSVLQMNILRGQSPDILRKEVWAHLLVYNLLRGVMMQAATVAELRPIDISFTAALQTVNAFLPHLHTAQTAEDAQVAWEVMIVVIGWKRVGNRPDRYEPRAVKRRTKKFPKLITTRKEARRRLREGVIEDGKRG